MNFHDSTPGRPTAVCSATPTEPTRGKTRRMLRELRHEVRQSVSTITGYTRLAGAMVGQRADVVQALETIRGNADHIVSVLDAFLGEHSPMADSAANAHLGAIAAEVVTTYLPPAQQRALGIHLEVATNLPDTPTFPAAALRRILHNLVSNAVKYSAPGLIKVEIRRRNAPDAIVLCVSNAEPHDGAAEVQDERLSGLTSEGLGLSLVERLVTSLDGRLDFRVSGQAGLTVEVTLPIKGAPHGRTVSPSADRPAARSSAGPAPPLHSPRDGHIAVVDGDTNSRRLAGFFLRRAGLSVTLFEHPAPLTTVDVTQLDAAIVDLHGDPLEGLSAAALLRDRGFRGPIVALASEESMPLDFALSGVGIDRVISRKKSWDDLADLLSGQIQSQTAGRRSCETARRQQETANEPCWAPQNPR